MSLQRFGEQLTEAVASGSAVANTTTETILFPNITIPANYMQNGRTVVLKAYGQYSTTATPTAIVTLRWNGVAGTVLSKTVAITLGSGVTAAVWETEIDIQVRSNGATGTIMANGHTFFGSALTQAVGSATGAGSYTNMCTGGVLTPSAVTVDLTADTALSLTWTWSAASASNTVTGLNYRLISEN